MMVAAPGCLQGACQEGMRRAVAAWMVQCAMYMERKVATAAVVMGTAMALMVIAAAAAAAVATVMVAGVITRSAVDIAAE